MVRGVGARSAGTRDQLVAAARRVMVRDGYGAMTYRAVAHAAAVSPGLVQYHFPRLESLFVAVAEVGTDDAVAYLRALTGRSRPLRALWRYAGDPAGTALLGQLMALAAHNPDVSAALGRGGKRVRAAMIELIERSEPGYPLREAGLTPAALVFTLTALPRMLHLESAFGVDLGHSDTVAFIEGLLDRIEPQDHDNPSDPEQETT
ncbi:TetR/AcrR family transcriptional regulator [Nocardia sp. NPDC051750]|uniref:TetR/AcrR family transcriptional regulator n=1 Tax=Nocardia sp. NPDC051750 TaxID=3364325 RepID=UPI00379AE1FE